MKKWTKWVILAVLAFFLLAGGIPLLMQRNFKEVLVKGAGVTDVFKLSKYFEPLEGTIGDTNVYEFKGKADGGKLLLIAGTHESEASAMVTAFLFVENLVTEAGTVYVIPHFNYSGSLGTQPGGGFPMYYTIPTSWGEKKFRLGDRGLQALDQWPDPDVYVHYPDGQLLSYIDSRNTNRSWPGKANGTMAEKITYAAMEMIRNEKIDVVIDLHEAETMFPVTNCIVAPERSKNYAVGAALYVKGREKFESHVEPSPSNFRGLSHREVGDYSDALVFLLEAPCVHLDQISGPKTNDLIIVGKDPFINVAAEKGLLYVPIDEEGWTIERRVGQQSSVIQEIINQYNKKNTDRKIVFTAPKHAEVVKNGMGYYFKDPEKVPQSQIAYE
jgi:hypothetical protein